MKRSVTRKIRILLVDAHTLVRRVLCERLQREHDFMVVGSVGTADEAIARTTPSVPDILLMDIDTPGQSCFAAVKRIVSIRTEARVLFLSALVCDRYIEEALAVHAAGYVSTHDPPETVIAAIREVAAGGIYFCEAVRSRLVVSEQGLKPARAASSRLSTLTVREREVLRYIASGMAHKGVAATMNISLKTAHNHCANLMKKLDIHDRVGLALFAVREGIVQA